MHEEEAAVYVNKIAAAIRQLNAAIRMYFSEEDELAIHTVVSAAFRILRDVSNKRGKNFGSRVLHAGICGLAEQIALGKLPKEIMKSLRESGSLQLFNDIAEKIRNEGKLFNRDSVEIVLDHQQEQRFWPSNIANFLKHADRDTDATLQVKNLDNGELLMAASAASLELMKTPTAEIVVFGSYWVVKHDPIDELGGDYTPVIRQLRNLDAEKRIAKCKELLEKS